MRQKITITLSVLLLLLAVYLISRDLFRKPAALTNASCCGDEFASLKQIDSKLLGYTRTRTIETGVKGLTGIAVDNENRIFVCGNKQVIVFDQSGKKSREFTIDTVASCIATGSDKVYLGFGPGIACYTASGEKTAIWKPLNNEGLITSIAVDKNFVYAADAVNKLILKYSSDGKLVQELGKKDTLTGAPGFIIPSSHFDISFGDFSDLWVVNPGRLRLENYTTTGHYEAGWGIAGSENDGFSGCCNPSHIAILPDGNFVTYEKGVDKIKVFDPTGRFLSFIAGAGSFKGNADLQLNTNLVKDLAAGSDGSVYVLDAYSQINIFRKKDR
jgi:hypothetical protein